MAGKLIELKDAAKLLGISPDELNDIRSRGEVYGYRDGSSWKFKMDELERLAEERGIHLDGGDDSPTPFVASADDESDELSSVSADDDDSRHDSELDIESILVSDESLGHSSESASSTIIGKNGPGQSAEDSDIQLKSDQRAQADRPPVWGATDSDVQLIPDAKESDLHLVAMGAGEDSSVLVSSPSSDILSSSDTGQLTGEGSDVSIDSGSLQVSTNDSLALNDNDLMTDSGSESRSSSSLNLAGEEDDELVLGGSALGSDLSLGAGDSGINLNPSDSGLSLEDDSLDLGGSSMALGGSSMELDGSSMELDGSSSIEALELPEDDEIISLGDDQSSPEDPTQLKADDQFMLEPVGADEDDESSGSQVIALEDSEAFDQDAATLLGGEMGEALVAEDADMFGGGMPSSPLGGGAAQPLGATAGAVYAPPPEAPYTVWNVLPLGFILLFLAITGMMMMDLMRNLWAFDDTSTVSTALMDQIISALGLSQ